MNITIDLDYNDWLKNIPELERENTVNRYLKLGYITGTLCQTTVNPLNNMFDPIQKKLDCVSNQNSENLNMIGVKINENLDRVKTSIEKLTASNYKAVLQGQYGENLVESLIEHHFPDYTVEDTTKSAAASDYHLLTDNGDKIMIEVKNYKNTVPTSEVNKFIRDISQTACKVGIFISLNTGISNKKRFAIDEVKGKKIIFIPKAGTDGASIIWAILMGVELINTNYSHANVNETKLMELYSNFETILNSHYKLMQVIKDTKSKVDKSLESLYMAAVEQDIKMNNAYKDIKMKIRDEIGIQNVKLIEKEYEYFDEILSEMSVKNDSRYLLFYELLELCKNKKW